jgi:sigma-B regulation protein RsbU (phosphoserine phosphatase)
MNADDTGRMQCMTVWGGNASTNQAFDVSGLSIWIHSRAHGQDDQGGDVYYVSSCASGRITRMLIADVSGHGAAVSRTAETLRDSMQANVNHINQGRVVRSVNEEFSRRDGEFGFATAVVSTFFAPTKKLTLSNAGHPPPLLFQHVDREWSVHNSQAARGEVANNIPLGITPETQFDETQLCLDDGDMLLLYTDAFFEARNDRGEILGADGLCNVLENLDPRKPERLIPEFVEAVSGLRDGNVDADDSTVVLIRANGSKTPIRNSLLAPFRCLGGMLGLRPVRIVAPQLSYETQQ